MRKITPFQYAVFLYEITSQKADIEKLAAEFMKILVKNNDLGKINNIIKEFEKYEKKQMGIKEVEIASVNPISKDLKMHLLKIIGGTNKLSVKESLEPDLLSGMVITIDDMMIDGSLKRKLKELNKTLTYGHR